VSVRLVCLSCVVCVTCFSCYNIVPGPNVCQRDFVLVTENGEANHALRIYVISGCSMCVCVCSSVSMRLSFLSCVVCVTCFSCYNIVPGPNVCQRDFVLVTENGGADHIRHFAGQSGGRDLGNVHFPPAAVVVHLNLEEGFRVQG